MRIIEIKALNNRAHKNQTGTVSTIPEGWAVVPDDMECANFPFGEVETAEIDGIMTVTKWIPGELPAPIELTPAEKREQAYNVEKIIYWDGKDITVTEAATLWQYYAAEGNEKAEQLTILISFAKQSIREKYPD